MAFYTGENWQDDVLSRDWLDAHCLIKNIAYKLYKNDYSYAVDMEKKLLEIPEMKRLKSICYNECKQIDKIRQSYYDVQEKEKKITPVDSTTED